MSRAVKQPIGQKRLTNIAVVRFKTQGLRFEIACYRNTVMAWRNKIEKNLDDVLQTETVYMNVSKGILAKAEDLQKVFGTTDQQEICKIILAKGEMQVSDKERKSEYDTLFKDVIQVLVEKCVNPDTRRPYTFGVLERAVRALHFNVDPKRSAKQQALELLPKLSEQFPIARAAMRFRVQVPLTLEKALRDLLAQQGAQIEREDMMPAELAITCTIDPGAFRLLDAFVREEAGGAGRLEVVSLAVVEEGDSRVEDEDVRLGADFSGLQAARGGAVGAGPHFVLSGAGVVPAQQQQQSAAAADLTGRLAGASLADGGAAQQQQRGGAGGTADAAASRGAAAGDAGASAGGAVVCSRRPISEIPEEYSSRRERFLELDQLQAGWEVELSSKTGASTIDAAFFSPSGERFKSFADARRAALKARGAAAGGA